MRQKTLEERVAGIEDVEAIKCLKYSYAAYCDDGYDLDGIHSVFSPRGRWTANGFGSFEGREDICRFFKELSATVLDVLHYVMAPRIVLAEDGFRASGRFYLLCLSTSRNRKDPSITDRVVTLGTYDDQFVKIGGRWFIDQMVVNVKHASKL